MRLRLLAVGNPPPSWAAQAFSEYASRLPPSLKLEASLIPLARGHGAAAARAVATEGARLLAAVPVRTHVVALTETGEAWSTRALAARLGQWLATGIDVVLMAGGPDGLAPACLERADERWSLSSLTLPHALVRVVVAEQLYRAWSLNARHPYHRA